MMRLARHLLLCFALLPPASALAQASAQPVKAELLAETTAFLRGGDTTVALRLTPEPGWHTYWRNPGQTGTATRLNWTLPEGVSAGELQWPAPSRFLSAGLVSYGYQGPSVLLASISVPATATAGELRIEASAHWLACKTLCVPGEAHLAISLPVAEASAPDAANEAVFETARAALPVPADAAWRQLYGVESGRLTLALAGPELKDVVGAEFFANSELPLSSASAESVALEGDEGLRLSRAVAPGSTATQPLEGVLRLARADGSALAYTVRAQPGVVKALAAAPPSKPKLRPQTDAAETAPAAAGEPSLSLHLALLFALLGGLILNLMPCVFPVLSLKAYALLSAESDSAHRKQALAYTAGTVLSCVAAAAVLLALRAGGEALGWGFQLQSPAFLAGMILLLFGLGLSMSGVLELGAGMMGVGSKLAERQGLAGSFFTGVLAVVVASPCTAPFMGSALGFAITQPVVVALSVFAALGLGLALPFLAMGLFPALACLLPRPGAWMLLFKQAMAFPLYLTCAWLAWVLTRQAGADALGLLAVGLVLVALAAWLYGRPGRGVPGLVVAALALLATLAGLFSPVFRQAAGQTASSKAVEEHEAWSTERVAALQREGRTVFVNFTADWCITCKVNERGTLRSPSVEAAFQSANTVWLTGDWTRSDPLITAELARFGRNGVPLYLVYRPGQEPQVLPQLLTPQILLNALRP